MGAIATIDGILQRQLAVVLDGAQGTELERRGVDVNKTPLWSAQLLLDDPDAVRALHIDYLQAGSDVITTLTYQASFEGLAAVGLEHERAATVIRLAVQLAAEARDTFWSDWVSSQPAQPDDVPGQRHAGRHRPLIAFSCGPYGAYLADGSEFTGTYVENMRMSELLLFHRARIEAVRHDRNVDLLAFETVPSLKEALAIAELLRIEQYGKPAWISFSCKSPQLTSHGDEFAAECVPKLLGESGIFAIGVNCTSPAYVADLIRAASEELSIPAENSTPGSRPTFLLTYPNSGEEWDGAKREWKGQASELSAVEQYVQQALQWIQQGVKLVGGCCRTTPRHIAALRAAVTRQEQPGTS